MMTIPKPYQPGLFALITAAMLGACTSSPEVRELAEKTAANTAILSSAVTTLSQQSRHLAERRAASAARLSAATNRVNADVKLDLLLLRESGDTAALSTLRNFRSLSVEMREIGESAATDEAELIRQFLARRTEIESRAKALLAVAGTLAKLAKEESLADRARFLLAYGQEVRAEIKAKQAEAVAATAAGEKKLANIAEAPQ